ncbi:MAG TPA: DUF2652 domain-containing protein [Bacteroidia bacterium]|nr:DUF2652 domain-containing protein [Bacteroidia bacterium]
MDPTPQPALIFIPDISGFTQFVNETEITHSQFIIQELLEILIDSNILDMKVSEIEGDAILFYRTGNLPSGSLLADQARNMFVSFHQHLKRYDLDRICNCKACVSAVNLTVKIVAHQGRISLMKVKDREKLFGSDVILAHRLLKNDVPEKEYLLATNGTGIRDQQPGNSEWMELKEQSSTYEAGEVKYHYASFVPLRKEINEPQKVSVKIYRSEKPLIFEEVINAPAEKVFPMVADLKNRLKYMEGIKDVKINNERHNQINRLGTVHQCIFEKEVSEFITSDFIMTPDKMSVSETNIKMPFTTDWTVERLNHQSKVTIVFHMQFNPVMKLMFNVVMKRKFIKMVHACIDNLKRVCENN